MKVLLDRDKDVAYLVLEDELRHDPEGWSLMFLPPDVPTRVDLFWHEDDRLSMIRIEEASDHLSREALDVAVPFKPLG